jgi:hypothetical protein
MASPWATSATSSAGTSSKPPSRPAFTPPPERPEHFTTAYLHRVEELEAEVADAGLQLEAVYGVEGPAWLRKETLDDEGARKEVIRVARTVETERTLIGASAHMLAIAKRR